MADNVRRIAEREIHETLNINNIFMRMNGISFIDEPPRTFAGKLKLLLIFAVSSSLLFWMLVGEIAFTASLLVGSVSVEELIRGYVHIAGYDTMSFGKLIMIQYQRHAFRQLLSELPDIWPGPDVDAASMEIKRNSLQALRVMQIFYMCWNVFGVWMYNLTPIIVYLYRLSRGETASLDYIWHLYYPFDHTKPITHALVFIFEMFGGLSSVNAMLSADILFITMASHISMLLRVLQVKIRSIGKHPSNVNAGNSYQDCYDMIVKVVKIHQRLISYGNDLENAFTVVNLINVLLSSVNICCVVFSIVNVVTRDLRDTYNMSTRQFIRKICIQMLFAVVDNQLPNESCETRRLFLEPLMEMSNKLFIGAALTQMGVVCWYADDIYRASAGVADAVYESGWYQCDPRSRRALLVMLQRSQRPLYFTALKFRPITMMTYSSILTTSYSYFTLLYTSYSRT